MPVKVKDVRSGDYFDFLGTKNHHYMKTSMELPCMCGDMIYVCCICVNGKGKMVGISEEAEID